MKGSVSVMLRFLQENAGTIAVLLVLLAVIAAIIRYLIKEKRSGRGVCGGDCRNCGRQCGAVPAGISLREHFAENAQLSQYTPRNAASEKSVLPTANSSDSEKVPRVDPAVFRVDK